MHFYRFESNIRGSWFFLGYFRGFGGITGGLEGTVDGDVGILIEPGIAFEAGFGLLVRFEDVEIMGQETDPPFERFHGMVTFEGMCLALGFFDEFTVSDTGGRPVRGEMVGVEFEESGTVTGRANDDVFAVFVSFLDGVHGTPEAVDADTGTKIAHASGMRGGIGG